MTALPFPTTSAAEGGGSRGQPPPWTQAGEQGKGSLPTRLPGFRSQPPSPDSSGGQLLSLAGPQSCPAPTLKVLALLVTVPV